ncbi:MAG: NAD(P)-dependent glycerol-3-phosphate dehydrogenase [Opitutaceae bacterium]|nr:NAD(P)-dependent glycerol-3-phosphate dehydrogenase [Opitutaceae bacterium]
MVEPAANGTSAPARFGLPNSAAGSLVARMNFVVAGAGAWGTAFAAHLARLGHAVTLVPRRLEQALRLVSERENAEYLPGITLPPDLQIAHRPRPLPPETDAVLLACPSRALRETCARVRDTLPPARRLKWVLSLAKGLELQTRLRPSEVLREILPPDIAVGSLSGPTNALGVAKGLPAAMVLAVDGAPSGARALQSALSGPALRVYASDDAAGVELAGAMKNIHAIAAGVCDGLGLGDNARAALLTRSLAEMVRVGTALGARPETFYGLGGLGDLAATCYGDWSRNHEFGRLIGRGARPADLLRERKTVVEGHRACEVFAGLCRARGIEAPVILAVADLLLNGRPPSELAESLMLRGLKHERA